MTGLPFHLIVSAADRNAMVPQQIRVGRPTSIFDAVPFNIGPLPQDAAVLLQDYRT